MRLRPFLARLAAAALGISALIVPAHSDAPGYDRDRALEVSQAAVGSVVGGYEFMTPDRKHLSLHDLSGTPTVVSLVYTSCYHVCPLITQHLADVVEVARDVFGDDSFDVVTIGFDHQGDTPERMGMYAAERRISGPGWYFLSGDADSIRAVTEDLGFLFFRSPKGFDHTAQVSVLDGNGRIYRQVYGQDFGTPQLVEPLKELIYNTPREAGLVTALLDEVRLICTIYDPKSGRYRFDYSIFLRIIIGVLCLGGVAVVIVRSWRSAI